MVTLLGKQLTKPNYYKTTLNTLQPKYRVDRTSFECAFSNFREYSGFAGAVFRACENYGKNG